MDSDKNNILNIFKNNNIDTFFDLLPETKDFFMKVALYCVKNKKGNLELATKLVEYDRDESLGDIYPLKFDREKRLSELKSLCNDDCDNITFEEFEEWDDEDLKDAILIGPKNNKRCYQVENIYRWVEEKIKEEKVPKDPVNISHTITDDEINYMKNIMRRRQGTKYVSPNKKRILLDEKNVKLVISNPEQTWKKADPRLIPYSENKNNTWWPFFHIIVSITLPNGKSKKIDLGYIPAGIEPLKGEDSYLSSASLIVSIQKLWATKKLLKVHSPLDKISCCTVGLGKSVDYWFNLAGKIDRNKISELGAELRYQEY